MLDFDLAELYGVETAQLKRSVKRNLERFEGEDFMFEVTREELSRCQIGILNKGRGSNIKYLPFAFTELDDIYMALSQLANKQKQAAQKIIRKPIGFIHYENDKDSQEKE